MWRFERLTAEEYRATGESGIYVTITPYNEGQKLPPVGALVDCGDLGIWIGQMDSANVDFVLNKFETLKVEDPATRLAQLMRNSVDEFRIYLKDSSSN